MKQSIVRGLAGSAAVAAICAGGVAVAPNALASIKPPPGGGSVCTGGRVIYTWTDSTHEYAFNCTGTARTIKGVMTKCTGYAGGMGYSCTTSLQKSWVTVPAHQTKTLYTTGGCSKAGGLAVCHTYPRTGYYSA